MREEPAKKKKSPSLRKIQGVLLLLLVPILLAAAAFFTYMAASAYQKSRASMAEAVENQLRAVDESLGRVNYYLVDSLMNNAGIAAVRGGATQHEKNVGARKLLEDLEYQSNFWAYEFSFFYYFPGSDMFARRYHTSVPYNQHTEIEGHVLDLIATQSPLVNSQKWSHFNVDGKTFMVQVYSDGGGYMSSWIPCSSLFSFLDDLVRTGRGYSLLLDEEGRPLTEAGEQALENAESSVYRLQRGNIGLYVYSPPYVDTEELILPLMFIGVILLVVLGVSGYSLYYYRHYIETPPRAFQTHVDAYAAARESGRQRGFAELNAAAAAFDALQQQLNDLKIDIYEEKLSLAKTELEYYQLQIKPHFFVNCFSIIHAMVQKKDYARIQEFCVKLSNYVRYLMADSFSMVPLASEMKMAREYLDIQNIRHRTNTTLANSADEALLGCEIPPLLIMTFVENAVKHARNGEGLAIAINARLMGPKEGRCLEITICDNGAGYTPEQLSRLGRLEEDWRTSPNGQGVGIPNIYKRLRLIYGVRFSLCFSNNGGAQVRLVVPVGGDAAQ